MYLRITCLPAVALLFLLASCTNKNRIFRKLDAGRTGIHFNNLITENDSVNILDLEYVYNGGGIAVADFNNDSLPDLFFTGNMVSNRLYLNSGDMRFKDVTAASGTGSTKWCTGVAAVDINNDGLMDLYVCASIQKNAAQRANMLLINTGIDKDGVPHFSDSAAAYHLADTSYSTNAAFFDYDNDGDLDLYVITDKMVDNRYPNEYRKKTTDGGSPNADILYRNDWDSALGHPVYTDVSAKAGIMDEGFSLGINIADINQDGWKDIYVTNDFLTNDLLYINNHDGTFTNKAASYFKHTSYSAMGNDVTDINNDGLPDVIALDMLPENNYRKKMMMPANNYQLNLNNDQFGYQYQYARNTLQLNQGMAIKTPGAPPEPVFSELGFYAGVAQTDWSWTPLVTDFDNDGLRDIIITNGFPKDVTDHDFMTFRANASNIASKQEILEQIPGVKLHNYAYRNNGNMTFTDVSADWDMLEPTFSNGAVYADLDNDGDMDVVVNNIGDEASVYENTAAHGKNGNQYLQITFEGTRANRNGTGARAELHYDHGKLQVYENSPYRGYLSSVQNRAHFGLGKTAIVDSVIIKWPGGLMQILTNVPAGQVLHVRQADAHMPYSFTQPAESALFSEVSDSLNIHYRHEENDFSDFTIQKLLPHKFSQYGPGLAAGDVDGNGLDDLVCGGSSAHSAAILLQQPDGKFVEKQLLPGAGKTDKDWADLGLLLFDADGDGDLDLYTASGGYQGEPRSHCYQDKLYINNGKGVYTLDSLALPLNLASKSCVRAADFDKDGDLDIFVAGRVLPWNYPAPVSCAVYRNDSHGGKVKFTDITATAARDLLNIGLTCDAVWTDFDNDGWPDLVLAGEWMPVTFLKNEKGVLKKINPGEAVGKTTGFWNSIAPGDFDNDGDIDYVVGNMGQNSYYKASPRYPVKIYAKDFDDNGNYDAIPSTYLPDEEGNKKEFPAQTRDDLVRQMIGLRMKFQNYRSFATATMDQVLTEEELKGALILQAGNLGTCLMKNNGKAGFECIPLPMQAQISSITGMVAEDFNGDGNLDLVMNGNDFGTEVSVGRYDAFNGLYLQGDGKGGFSPVTIASSGIYIPGNGKAMAAARTAGGKYILAATQNRGPLKVFELNRMTRQVAVQPLDVSAMIRYKNGKTRRQELYYGSSFLSQSARFIPLQAGVIEVDITDYKGNKRSIKL